MSQSVSPPTPDGTRKSSGRVLLVDDDSDQVMLLGAMLTPFGIDVTTASSAEQALRLARQQSFDVVVTDLNLPGASGINLTRELRQRDDPPAVVVITGGGSLGQAIEALKLGASDYVQKPMDPTRLVSLVKELLKSSEVQEIGNESELGTLPVFEGMLGRSPCMREVFARIERVATTGAPVLIVGESGTGKELVARALHNKSRRSSGPFVPVHTGAIPRELIASDLFGHEKGAFTGALGTAEGKFEAAEGGTLFLDEVGTMDVATQISLLRVLETYRYTRVGATKEKQADVRIVAATNRDLLDLVEMNSFREDLYYRLNVFTVALPPLRERRDDVIPIAERFLRSFAKRYQTVAKTLSGGATERLLAHDWPGNVRELRNVMEQTAVFARHETVQADEIQLVSTRLARPNATPREDAKPIALAEPREALAPESQPEEQASRRLVASDEQAESVSPNTDDESAAPSHNRPSLASAEVLSAVSREAVSAPADDHPMVLRISIGTSLAEVERLVIIKTLEASNGNKQAAARILGISRRGLYTKLIAFGEHVPSDEAGLADGGSENGSAPSAFDGPDPAKSAQVRALRFD